MHYNEFKVVEFARKLIKADEEALANEEEGASGSYSRKLQVSHFYGLVLMIKQKYLGCGNSFY